MYFLLVHVISFPSIKGEAGQMVSNLNFLRQAGSEFNCLPRKSRVQVPTPATSERDHLWHQELCLRSESGISRCHRPGCAGAPEGSILQWLLPLSERREAEWHRGRWWQDGGRRWGAASKGCRQPPKAIGGRMGSSSASRRNHHRGSRLLGSWAVTEYISAVKELGTPLHFAAVFVGCICVWSWL